MVRQYYLQTIRRAVKDTLADIGFRSRMRALVKVLWVALAIFIMWIFGWHTLAIDKLGEISAGFLALFSIVVLVFMLNLIAAPARMDAEKKAIISDLEKRLDNREERQKAISEMWKLRKAGVNHRNKTPKSDYEYQNWKEIYDSWYTDVLTKANSISPNFASWLETMDRMRPEPSLPAALPGDHQDNRHYMSEVLLRIQEYLQSEMLYRDMFEKDQ